MGDQIFQLLHLSDIHMQTKAEFDTFVVLDPLIKRVREDREKGFAPEIIVVTGDIAFKGIKEEYDLAKVFFDKLLDATGLSEKKYLSFRGIMM